MSRSSAVSPGVKGIGAAKIQRIDGPALVAAMRAAKVSDRSLMLRTGRSAITLHVWKRDGVPRRMKERVLVALMDPSPVDESPRHIPAAEFRGMFEASGLKRVALARAVPVGKGTVARWTQIGVKASLSERVRHVLAHPDEFRHMALTSGAKEKPKAMSGPQYRALTSASGLLVPEIAAVLGVPDRRLNRWRTHGVSAEVAAEAREMFGDAVPALPLRGSDLVAMMQRERLSVSELASRCGVLVDRVHCWRQHHVPARWSESVAAHVAGEHAPRIPSNRAERQSVVGARAIARTTTAPPMPGGEFAILLAATHLSQSAFGDLMGVRQTTVSNWKSDRVPARYVDVVMEVLRELDVKV